MNKIPEIPFGICSGFAIVRKKDLCYSNSAESNDRLHRAFERAEGFLLHSFIKCKILIVSSEK